MRIDGSNIQGLSGAVSYEYIATDQQTDFPLEFTLKTTSIIFVNGSALSLSDYSGINTEVLILNTPSFNNDVIKVLR